MTIPSRPCLFLSSLSWMNSLYHERFHTSVLHLLLDTHMHWMPYPPTATLCFASLFLCRLYSITSCRQDKLQVRVFVTGLVSQSLAQLQGLTCLGSIALISGSLNQGHPHRFLRVSIALRFYFIPEMLSDSNSLSQYTLHLSFHPCSLLPSSFQTAPLSLAMSTLFSLYSRIHTPPPQSS